MQRCRECKCTLHAGKAWEEEHDGKKYRYIHQVCMNKKCKNYRQTVDTEVIEINEPAE